MQQVLDKQFVFSWEVIMPERDEKKPTSPRSRKPSPDDIDLDTPYLDDAVSNGEVGTPRMEDGFSKFSFLENIENLRYPKGGQNN